MNYYFTSDHERLAAPESDRVLVEFLENPEHLTHKINLFTNHKHHLPTMFIHVDGNLENDPQRPNIMARPQPQRTLKEHLQALAKEKSILPVMELHGANGGVEYVPEEVRAIIKAIISALIYLHTRGGSLVGPLIQDNFVIYDDYLALRHLSFRDNTEETRRQDFGYVHDFIVDNIFSHPYMAKIPQDMRNLLDTLDSYDDSLEVLVAYHYATMSHSERIYFMKNCSDKKYMIPDYKKIIIAIKESPRNNKEREEMWWKCVEKSVFKKMVNCYRKGKYYFGTTNAYLSNDSAMRCCRNLATHLGEQSNLLSEDIDIMVSSVFTPMLLRFAEELYKRKALSIVITWME